MKRKGNRCGHDPSNPRWFEPPKKHAHRPGVLRKLIERIRDYYSAPAKTLPTLNAVNESERQQRSERREACVALLGCLLHYTDLVTLRVGIPGVNGFQGLTMNFLAEASGLSLSRAERAMHDLAAAGLVSVHPIAKRLDDCTYKGLAAIRAIKQQLFAAFGLSAWLKREREKAAKRLEKKQRKANQKKLASFQMLVGAAIDRICRPEARTSRKPVANQKDFEHEKARQLQALRDMMAKGQGPPEKT